MCIIISYILRNHWILIEIDVSDHVIQYYNLLSNHDLSAICEFIKTQIKYVNK